MATNTTKIWSALSLCLAMAMPFSVDALEAHRPGGNLAKSLTDATYGKRFVPHQYAQNGSQNGSQNGRSQNLRSRNEVVREVKRRHRDAEILRITLDRRAMLYRVRVYLADGRVTTVSVDALR